MKYREIAYHSLQLPRPDAARLHLALLMTVMWEAEVLQNWIPKNGRSTEVALSALGMEPCSFVVALPPASRSFLRVLMNLQTLLGC